jgi:hypothetical protein
LCILHKGRVHFIILFIISRGIKNIWIWRSCLDNYLALQNVSNMASTSRYHITKL